MHFIIVRKKNFEKGEETSEGKLNSPAKIKGGVLDQGDGSRKTAFHVFECGENMLLKSLSKKKK